MPGAPRCNKKAQKILYKIIGLPENKIDDLTPKEKKIRERLIYEDGRWTR